MQDYERRCVFLELTPFAIIARASSIGGSHLQLPQRFVGGRSPRGRLLNLVRSEPQNRFDAFTRQGILDRLINILERIKCDEPLEWKTPERVKFD
jgi:hypothetical protein